MKKILVAALASALLFTACKKEDTAGDNATQVISASSVPAAVLQTFNTTFSGATEVEWMRESSSSRFRSQFNQSSRRQEATFDDSGHHLSTTEQCSSAVPAAVVSAFRAQFPNDVVYEWKLMTDGNWKPHFMRGTVKWEATITPAGAIIKVEHA